MLSDLQKRNRYDLKKLLAELLKQQPGIVAVYLFGSRAYNTGSRRSDCDLLLQVARNAGTKSSDLRNFSITQCPALDFFLCAEARATSCSNDSFVYAASFPELTKKLDAILLWDKTGSFADFAFPDTGNWEFETADIAHFAMTSLPDAYIGEQSWQAKIRAVEAQGLPVRPYVGDTLLKAVTSVAEVARRMVFNQSDLGPRGSARAGWTVNLRSEYDCQNLVFTVVKPWFPDLVREEVAISFDGQQKHSDFSLFRGKLIIEMKFIDSNAKKSEVVKTLDGLAMFYKRNANVGCLLMIVFVKAGISIDPMKWEHDYSHKNATTPVLTIVVTVP
jgi:hypothetical protein